MEHSFFRSLVAQGAHPSLGAHAETYGRLIGDWVGEVHLYPPGAERLATSAEAHFEWVLEGRAIQDVWITPSRKDRASGIRAPAELYGLGLYGTTLRVFSPKTESWQVVWWDPPSGVRSELEGRRIGDDVVQLGLREGRPIRWTFSALRPDSFVWQAHALEPDGATWGLQGEFAFRRERR
jgi:hypothetical protein